MRSMMERLAWDEAAAALEEQRAPAPDEIEVSKGHNYSYF